MRYFVLANYNSNRGFLDNTDLNDGYSTQVEMYSLKLRSNLEAAITKTTTARMNLMGRLMQYQLPNAGVALDDMYDTPSAAFPIRVPGGAGPAASCSPIPWPTRPRAGTTRCCNVRCSPT